MSNCNELAIHEIPCLGVVPKDWKKSRFKYVHKELEDRVGDNSDSYKLLSLTKKGVIHRDLESGKGKFPASFENYKITGENCLIFCLFDIDETPRTVGISNEIGMITGAYKIYEATEELMPKFSYYVFLVIDDVKGLKPFYTGLRKVVKPQTFENLSFFLPNLVEQSQIVSYLDRKTALIDSLIEKTERKIALLKEKRTALINQAVTKGLDPNVKMKDSGVEWIGEIPEHWEVVKLKRIVSENQRSLPNSTNPNFELFYIEISDVNSDGIISAPTKYLFSEAPSRCRRIVQEGDVIISTVRTYLKAIGLIESEKKNLVCSTGFSVLTPTSRVDSEFLFYALRSEEFIAQVITNSNGVSYPAIQSESLINLFLPICDIAEQKSIVRELKSKVKTANDTVQIEENRIEKLKEYRQALISEVVTGKIKVTEDV